MTTLETPGECGADPPHRPYKAGTSELAVAGAYFYGGLTPRDITTLSPPSTPVVCG